MTLKLTTVALGGLLLLAVPAPNLSARQEGASAPAAAESAPADRKRRPSTGNLPMRANPRLTLDAFLNACRGLAEERAAGTAGYPSPEAIDALARSYAKMTGAASAEGEAPLPEFVELAKAAIIALTPTFDKVKQNPAVLTEPVAKDAKGVAIIPQEGTPEALTRDVRVVGMMSMTRLMNAEIVGRKDTGGGANPELIARLQQMGATQEQIDNYSARLAAAAKARPRPDRHRRGNRPAEAPPMPEIKDPSELPLKVLESRVAQLETQVAAATPGPDKARLEKELAFYQKRLAEKRVKELGVEKPKDGAAAPTATPEGTPK